MLFIRVGNEHSGSISAGNFLTSREPVSFTRKTPLHGVSNWILCLCIGSNFIFMCRVWQWNSKIFYNFNNL